MTLNKSRNLPHYFRQANAKDLTWSENFSKSFFIICAVKGPSVLKSFFRISCQILLQIFGAASYSKRRINLLLSMSEVFYYEWICIIEYFVLCGFWKQVDLVETPRKSHVRSHERNLRGKISSSRLGLGIYRGFHGDMVEEVFVSFNIMWNLINKFY